MLLLSACASPTLKDFQDKPSAVNFTVSDARPNTDKIDFNGSLAHNNCLYNVFQLGDSYTKPTRIVLFRHDFEGALGARLQNKTTTILEYRLYMNLRTGGGSGCVQQEHDAGWLAASRPDAASSWVVDIRATTGGKEYSVLAVTKFAEVDKNMSYGDEIFFAMRRANALLIEKIGKDLPVM